MTEQEVKDKVKAKSRKFEQLFNTPLGKEVLEAMRDEFDVSEMRGKSTEDTYFNLGRRDAVVYIDQMVKYSGAENETN